MLRRFSVNFAIFSMVLDMSLTLLALQVAAWQRPYLPPVPFLISVESYQIPPLIYIIVPILWSMVFLLSSVYDPQRNYKFIDEFQHVFVATAVSSLIFAGILYIGFREFSRYLLITFVILDLFFLISWRVFMRVYFRRGRFPTAERLVLIVGAGSTGLRVSEMIHEFDWTGLNIIGYLDDDREKRAEDLPILGGVNDARFVVESRSVDDVVIALPQRAYSKINDLVATLQDLPVNVRIVPDYFSLALYRASAEDFGGMPMINLRDPALNDVQRMVKRLFDLTISSIVAIFAFPFFLSVALAVKLDSKGSVFFHQERIGENGRTFRMYKFRTMIPDAEKMQDQISEIDDEGRLIFKRPDDPRITKVGRILRKTSLDELPQLINVFKGDMSLVGPRPELPWVMDQYEVWQHKRFSVPQGMTGWWQVNGRSDNPMHLNTEDDIYYVQNYSIWMDIYILLKTPWVVLRGKGAY